MMTAQDWTVILTIVLLPLVALLSWVTIVDRIRHVTRRPAEAPPVDLYRVFTTDELAPGDPGWGPGWRLIDGRWFYSAAWIDADQGGGS